MRPLLKRVFDLVGATLLLFLFAPLLVIVAICIKIGSHGSIIFKQRRVGKNGKPISILKFRSMNVDVSPALHKAHITQLIEKNLSLEQFTGGSASSLKLEKDSRITGVGRIIRKTSIDELPQLFNVLRGEMSLVGPRPPLPYEVKLYKDWHMQRLEVLPGITGWWQVNGRNRVSFDEMVAMDIFYIEHSSFWLDVKILFLTPWAVISGVGAG